MFVRKRRQRRQGFELANDDDPVRERLAVRGRGDHDGPSLLEDAVCDEARELVHDLLVMDVDTHPMSMRVH